MTHRTQPEDGIAELLRCRTTNSELPDRMREDRARTLHLPRTHIVVLSLQTRLINASVRPVMSAVTNTSDLADGREHVHEMVISKVGQFLNGLQ